MRHTNKDNNNNNNNNNNNDKITMNNKIKVLCFIVLCTLIGKKVRVFTPLPSIFFVLFLHVERVCKSLLVGHLHNTVRALLSPSRCFQL